MIWVMVFLLMTAIVAFVGYLKFAKTEEALYEMIDFGIRCAYVGLQVFLAIGGIVFLWVMVWWLVG
jgi:hypothetical protein